MAVIEIKIELKKGVADPEGQNTKKALELLGFSGVRSVKTVKTFQMELDAEGNAALAMGQEMCRKLLANPVIQSFHVELK
ncbi:MAG: phosphoribosylformylglycinamidine synthase, purS protein [Spirochaetia bacterium]|nr:phosphoribosylformylglycinamidine synthase, purS protein [Spirochaetia bacterium]